MNSNIRAASFFTHLQSALRGEGTEMERLERNITDTLSDTRTLGDPHVPETKRGEWNQQWETLQGAIRSIQQATAGVRRCVETASPENTGGADTFLGAHQRRLADLFVPLREMGAGFLTGDTATHWADLWTLVEAQVACIRAHAFSMDMQLVLQRRYGADLPNGMRREIVARGPQNGNGNDAHQTDPDKFGEEYRQAENELRRERQQPGDGNEILKALFMYVEAPEERVHNKHVSEMERAELPVG